MQEVQNKRHRDLSNLGLAAFLIGLAATGYLLWIGLSGAPWPKWLLALTTVF